MSGRPIDDAGAASSPDRRAGRVLGVILAGGLSRRMGVDKGFVVLAGKPLIAHAIARFQPQVDVLVLNANGDPGHYAPFALPVVADTLDNHPGPLAGVLAAMRWAAANAPDVTHVATAAVDTPFFPMTMVERLAIKLAATDGRVAFVTTASGPQPVFALIDVNLADALERDLVSGRARRVVDWLRAPRHVEVLLSDADRAFFNVNTPDDVATAEAMLR